MQNYVVDIDGTLCTIEDDYSNAKPFFARIKKINELHAEGNTIIIYTGRHWRYLQLTKSQLKNWGLKYHSLIMGKPFGLLIDDMSIHPDEFFK